MLRYLSIAVSTLLLGGYVLFRHHAYNFPIRGRHVKLTLWIQHLLLLVQGVQTTRAFIHVPCPVTTLVPGIAVLILICYSYRMRHIMLRMRADRITPDAFRQVRQMNINVALWTATWICVTYALFYMGSPRYTAFTCETSLSPLLISMFVLIGIILGFILVDLCSLWKYPPDGLGLRYEILSTTLTSTVTLAIVGCLYLTSWSLSWSGLILAQLLIIILTLTMAWIPAFVSIYSYHTLCQSDTSTFSLIEILRQPNSRSQFEEFLRDEMSLENLNFYEEVTSWLNIEGNIDEARAIEEKFFDSNSQYEINIGSSLKTKVREAIETENIQAIRISFEQARDEVFTLMNRDSFHRFQAKPTSLSFIAT